MDVCFQRATCNMVAIFISRHSISNLIAPAAEGERRRGLRGRYGTVLLLLFFFYLSVSCHVQQNAFNMSNELLLLLFLLLCVRLQECKFNLVN